MNRRQLFWFIAAAPCAIVATPASDIGDLVPPVVMGKIRWLRGYPKIEQVYAGRMSDAIARVYFIERLPGESRQEFEARNRHKDADGC
jgi:hypothetical protein